MRRATLTLARQTAAGIRCHPADPPRQYAACVVPALRRAGIGGRVAATTLNVAITALPMGPCRGYLLALGGRGGRRRERALAAAPPLQPPSPAHAAEIATQVALTARMLRRAATAAPADVCSVEADGPAA